MNKQIIVLGVCAIAALTTFSDVRVERLFRAPRFTRDSTNVKILQTIDKAAWIWSAEDTIPEVRVFKCAFEVKEGEGPLTIDVSADERFYLTIDGTFVARGPNRGTVENWQYETYQLTLAPGTHELRAVVTRFGEHSPVAQISHRGGFILSAEEPFFKRLTTGIAKWQVAADTNTKPLHERWAVGGDYEITGAGVYDVAPTTWQDAKIVRVPVRHTEWGGRTLGWMLFPSQLPDQTEIHCAPGAIRAVTREAEWCEKKHIWTDAETKNSDVRDFNALLKGEKSELVIPAKTRLQLAWHLGRYICAYPVLKASGGKGARIGWAWSESAKEAQKKLKRQRDAIVGKYLDCWGDRFISDGRTNATFTTAWFRCGLWCRLDIETQDEPLTIGALELIESRYPVEMESSFTSPDDPTLGGVRDICARAMQMCAHEMLFDCPFYEQQMYPGDTRVQLLTLTALSRDDRLIKRAIEIYDLGTRDDGQCPFNFPTRGLQEGFSYTLPYLCMYGDYVQNHADRAWLRARIPGLRKSLAGCELYENEKGLVEHTPGWNFMDWAEGWENNGTMRNCKMGYEMNSFVNLFWLLAMQSGAATERALGNELQAAYWDAKAERLKAAIVETFWDEGRGLLADTPAKNAFCEHSQAMAILADALPEAKRETCFRHLVSDNDLARTTVYFSYYLFEAYFKMGRADLFQKRLDLWRGYVKKGLTTTQEAPDKGPNGEHESRSDCHAWGTHPIWFMQTGLAGIRSAAPFFEKVRVAPQPGSLTALKARHPHPKGWIEADLRFEKGAAHGTITTPVAGTFVWQGRETPLAVGANTL